MSDPKDDNALRNVAFALLVCAAIGAASAFSGLLESRFVIALGAAAALLVMSVFFHDKKLYFLALLAFFLPVNINKAVYRIDNPIPSLSDTLPFYAADAVLVILYVIWIYRLAHNGRSRRVIWMTPVLFFLLMMVAADILSLVNAVTFRRSFIEITCLVKVVITYFYVVNNISSMKEIKVILAVFAAGLILQATIVLLEYYTHGTLGLIYFGELPSAYLSYEGERQVFRPAGLFSHPNLFSNYLEFLIPLMLALSFLTKHNWLRRLATVAAVAGGLALIFTLSRGGWVGVAFASLCVFYYLTKRNLRDQKFFFKTLFVILLGASLMAVFAPKIIYRVISRDRGAAMARVHQYYVAREIITSHPLVGVGINNYIEVMDEYDETSSRISRGFLFPIHTVYLEYYAETGIAGIVALLSLFFVIFASGIRNISRSEGFLFNLNLGLVFGFVAYSIHCVSDMNYLSRVTVFAFFAAFFSVVNYAINGRITLADE